MSDNRTATFRLLMAAPFLLTSSVFAKPRSPLPDTAFDGGVISAETLAQGNSMAGNLASLTAGSENPASLITNLSGGVYTTLRAGQTSELTRGTINEHDPLQGKTLNYISIGADKGVLYYEPLGRLATTQDMLENGANVGTRDIEFASDAIGFAGAQAFKKGTIGISLAYLTSSLATTEHRTGQPDASNLDNGYGVRMNIGLLYPYLGSTWGMVIQNAPGFIWGSDYRREMLPFKIRVGNMWQYSSYLKTYLDAEWRFYHEGSNREEYVHAGVESALGKYVTLRAGTYGSSLDNSKTRHWTGGIAFNLDSGATMSYALDRYEESNTKVSLSYVSFSIPIDKGGR